MTFPHPRHTGARAAYGELPSRREMRADARAARDRLRLDRASPPTARTVVTTTPTLRHPVQPPGPPPAALRIDRATARLAGALSLHLD